MNKILLIEAVANRVHHWHPVIWAKVELSLDKGLIPELLAKRKELAEQDLFSAINEFADVTWHGGFQGLGTQADEEELARCLNHKPRTILEIREGSFYIERPFFWIEKGSILKTAKVGIDDLISALASDSPLRIGERIFPAGDKVVVPCDLDERDRLIDVLFKTQALELRKVLSVNALVA